MTGVYCQCYSGTEFIYRVSENQNLGINFTMIDNHRGVKLKIKKKTTKKGSSK